MRSNFITSILILIACCLYSSASKAQVWSELGTSPLSAGDASNIKTAIAPDGTLYAFYADKTNSEKAALKKYNASSNMWEVVGNSNTISVGYAAYLDLTFAPDGTLYVLFNDGGNGNKVFVKKFNVSTNSFSDVGNITASITSLNYPSITISKNIVYVVYSNCSEGCKSYAVKYTNNTWEKAGDVSAGYVVDNRIITAADGTMYVAYRDYGKGPAVKKYNAALNSWIAIGNGPVSTVEQKGDLAFSSDNTLYITAPTSNNTLVQKYNSGTNSWENVGNLNISDKATTLNEITIAPDNTVYIAYIYTTGSFMGTQSMVVKKLDPVSNTWLNVANATPSIKGSVNALSLNYFNNKLYSTYSSGQSFGPIGPTSGGAFAYTLSLVSVPATVTNLVAKPGNAQVELSWTANALGDNVSGYNVYRGTAANTITEKLNTAAVTSTTFTDNTAVNFTTYYYAVTAVNADGESAKSTAVNAMAQMPVAPEFTSKPLMEATENIRYSYTLTATDANDDNISFSGTTLPAWLTIGPGNTLTGIPEHADVGTHEIVLNASDGNLSTEQKFTITVTDKIVPVTTTFSPVPLATDVALDANLSVTFSEEIKKGAGNIIIKKVSDNSVVEQIEVTSPQITINNQSELVINPAISLPSFTNLYVTIEQTAVSDLAGNQFAGITNNNIWRFKTIDVPVAPVFTSKPVTDVNENTPYTYTLSATDANEDAITFSAESLPEWLSLSKNKLIGTPKLSDVGTYDIKLIASDGTLTAEQKFTITVKDITAPTVVISSSQTASAKEAFTVTFTFREEIKDFALEDITTINALVSNLQTQDNITFTATVTPSVDGEVSLQVKTATLTDVNGNANTASNVFKLLYDATAPTVVISSIAPSVLNKAFSVTFTFSEDVVGVAPEDVTLTNATVSTFTKVTNKTYTATITPTNNGTVSVALAAAKAQDNVGNDNLASAELTREYNITRPTVELITTASDPTNAAFTVNIQFSEEVTGFTGEDITVTNAGISEFTLVSATTYTATITPAAQGEVQISLAANVAEDVATNGNEASNGLKLIFDSIAPKGYAVSFNQEKIDFDNQTNVSAKVTGAETGTDYFYEISSSSGGTSVTGTASAITGNFEISNLDVTILKDGQITFSFYQQDAAGNKGKEVTDQVKKLTRNIVSVTQPATVTVPIRTTFLQVSLPTTVEVTYSDNTKQQVAVTWQPGNYNAYTANQYEITGILTLAPGTSNQNNLQARIIVEVQPNKIPTGLALSTTTFSPNITTDEVIGNFSTVDPDDPEFTYSLVSGAGDINNSLFEIRQNQLYLKSNQGLSGQTQFTIRVRTTDTYNNRFEQSFTLTKAAYAKAVDQLKVVNAFSPNGDGVNDEWTVPELKFYNQVNIEVFDRSGVRLFQTTNPEKGWNGQNLNGKVLPGAYLYIIQVEDIKLTKKGVITVLKK